MTDWNDLTRDWQSDRNTIDIDAVVRRAHKKKRSMQVRLAIEVLASIGVVLFWAPQLPHAGAGTALLGVGSLVFVLAWCVLLWRNQRGTWAADGTLVADFMALERRRIDASLRWTTVLRGSLLAMSVLFLAASPFLLRDGWNLYRQEPWRFVVGFVGFFAIVGALSIYSTVQRKKLTVQRDALRSAPENSPP
jgi:hypothetical protein